MQSFLFTREGVEVRVLRDQRIVFGHLDVVPARLILSDSEEVAKDLLRSSKDCRSRDKGERIVPSLIK
jgi:hypothetical protein